MVGLGPGSYAGVRIAIATALGLRAAAGAGLVGLPSICAIDPEEYCLRRRRAAESFTLPACADGRCLEGPVLCDEERDSRRLIERNGHLPFVSTEPLPQFAGVDGGASRRRFVSLDLRRKRTVAVDENLEPIYLRAPYITPPKQMKSLGAERCWAEIDLAALHHNARVARERHGRRSCSRS